MNCNQGFTPEDINLVKKLAAWVHKMYCHEAGGNLITREDLYHTGIIGLLDAMQHMNEAKNPEAYKAIRVKGQMMDLIRKQTLVSVPRAKWRMVKQVRQAAEALNKAGTRPTVKAICELVNAPAEVVEKALRTKLAVVPADGDCRNGDEGFPVGAILSDPSPDPEQALMKKELTQAVQYCLKAISNAVDRIILICRMEYDMRLKVLARVLGITIEGTRQKQLRAQEQMKNCLEEQGWTADSLE
jgi:RNA polymerase sigma factor FliA